MDGRHMEVPPYSVTIPHNGRRRLRWPLQAQAEVLLDGQGAGGYAILAPQHPCDFSDTDVPKKSKDNPLTKPGNDVLMASYKAGFADGRLEAIEESMDTVAALVVKAETMIAGLGDDADSAIKSSASHTLRALHLAFAAVTGSANGSAAFQELLEQSRQRLQKKNASMH